MKLPILPPLDEQVDRSLQIRGEIGLGGKERTILAGLDVIVNSR
jgi:hypothetical protein